MQEKKQNVILSSSFHKNGFASAFINAKVK